MSWHDYLALALFAAAAAFVAARAYRAFFARAKAGCSTGCGSCRPTSPTASQCNNLISIGPPPD